jgi:branched-chain amino acid transport system permease protein
MKSTDKTAIIAAIVMGTTAALGVPLISDTAELFNLTVYIVMSVLALSLALVWGCGGILCFGQAAFFGLGAYTYAIAVINIGDSTLPIVLAVAVPALFAAVLGYFMFYARLADVYLGVITMVVTLIFFDLIRSTAGPEYRIGAAFLGGYNGMPAIPPINWPGDSTWSLEIPGMFRLSTVTLLLAYVAIRLLLRTHFGRVIVAIRENEIRAELLGYDTRLYKVAVFTLGAGLAGLAGCLYANWGGYVSPDVFSLSTTAQVIMWVIVGGIGTLVGPVVGCFLLQMLLASLGTQQMFNNYLVLGTILLVFVLLVPRGILPVLMRVGRQLAEVVRWPAARSARDVRP